MTTQTTTDVDLKPNTVSPALIQRFENEWRQMREPSRPTPPTPRDQ
ncbi:hypothetical protein [Ensifer soli]